MRVFNLSNDGIDWAAGALSGHVPYSHIRLVRMSYRPTSLQSQRFVTELWAEGGALKTTKLKIASCSWKSMVEQERLDQPYSTFLGELHRRMSATNVRARFEHGGHPLVYWPSLAVFLMVGLGLAALVARTFQEGSASSAAIVAAFLAVYLWQGGNFLRRNRPGQYRPEEPPGTVMPQ
jgi:hypothetical protein